MKNNLEEKKWK